MGPRTELRCCLKVPQLFRSNGTSEGTHPILEWERTDVEYEELTHPNSNDLFLIDDPYLNIP